MWTHDQQSSRCLLFICPFVGWFCPSFMTVYNICKYLLCEFKKHSCCLECNFSFLLECELYFFWDFEMLFISSLFVKAAKTPAFFSNFFPMYGFWHKNALYFVWPLSLIFFFSFSSDQFPIPSWQKKNILPLLCFTIKMVFSAWWEVLGLCQKCYLMNETLSFRLFCSQP